MQTINISELRANLLSYLQKVHDGEEISVTTNGTLLATIVPPVNKKQDAKKKLQQIALNAKIHDIESPVLDEWNALK